MFKSLLQRFVTFFGVLLRSTVKKRHADLPSEIEELNESVGKFEMLERDLTQVLPLVEKMEALLNETAEDLNEIEKVEKQKVLKEKEKETSRKKLEEARKKLDTAKNLLGDAKLLDKLIEDKIAAKDNVETARDNLFDFEVNGSWTLEQFEEAREDAQVCRYFIFVKTSIF
uniref:Uncharacterized protein n=1 Tax=Panagrolaimus superbus TaxID=310955 RepID=A0A914Y8I6_9BILA